MKTSRLHDWPVVVAAIAIADVEMIPNHRHDHRMRAVHQPPIFDRVRREEWFGVLGAIAQLPNVQLDGLMTMAPVVDDPEQARPVFRALRELRDEIEVRCTGVKLPQLSMGMTDDFEVAIEEGATLVRIGRAIFGERL